MSLSEEELQLAENFNIPVIDEERNYWFIRTEGGEYFDSFYFDSFIGIEWNEISNLDEIKNNDIDYLKGRVYAEYPNEKKPGYIAKQIKKFVCDIHKGDIVLIPNKNSEKIAFGEIIDEDAYTYEENNEGMFFLLDDEDNVEILKKRRNVRWFKVLNRDQLDPYLYKIIYSHSAIVDASPYEKFIDRTLHKIYIKGDKASVSMNVTTKEGISAIDISSYVYNTVSLIDLYNSFDNTISYNKNSIEAKINVQSPGIVEFVGPIAGIACIALVTVAILGGETSFFGIHLKTDGLSKNILEWVKMFKNSKSNISDEIKSSSNNLKLKAEYEKDINQINNLAIESEKEKN